MHLGLLNSRLGPGFHGVVDIMELMRKSKRFCRTNSHCFCVTLGLFKESRLDLTDHKWTWRFTGVYRQVCIQDLNTSFCETYQQLEIRSFCIFM